MGFFGIFPFLFGIMFVFVCGFIIYNIVSGISKEKKNDAAPRLTVMAAAVAKRADVTHHRNANNHSYSTTHYFVTFQVESGDRFELSLAGEQYALIVEGDNGSLTFQGTRFLSFERT